MMISNELEELLVKHVGDLDDGAKRLTAVSMRVGEAMDELTADWALEQQWEKGDGSWNDDADLSVAPPEWKNGDAWLSWFGLDYGSGDDGEFSATNDYFWLTRLCREGEGQIGFRFNQDIVPKVPWKKFLKAKGNQFAAAGFILDDEPSLFLPIRVDVTTLAAAVREEKIEDGLQALRDSLDTLRRSRPQFDALIAEAKQTQGIS